MRREVVAALPLRVRGRRTPIYFQIAAQIEELIDSGELEPGAALPSAASVARQLRISEATAARAVQWLEARGRIVRRGHRRVVARTARPPG